MVRGRQGTVVESENAHQREGPFCVFWTQNRLEKIFDLLWLWDSLAVASEQVKHRESSVVGFIEFIAQDIYSCDELDIQPSSSLLVWTSSHQATLLVWTLPRHLQCATQLQVAPPAILG